MMTRIKTNEKFSEEQRILQGQIDSMNDQYDAIELIKALEAISCNEECRTISTLHSDRTFKKLPLLLESKNYLCSNMGTADSGSDMVQDEIRFSIGYRRVLHIMMVHSHMYKENVHSFTLYMSVYKIDYDLNFDTVRISDLVKKIRSLYKLDEIMDPRDNQGSSRKRV